MRSTLFEIFGIPVRSYGFMMVVGFAFGLWRIVRVGRKRGFNVDQLYDLGLIVLLSGVAGARITYIFLNSSTESWHSAYAVWQGGLSFHGGVIFAIIAGAAYIRLKRLSFWDAADLFAPSLALAYAFTRIGCFLNGCCYGCPTNLPWAVRFNNNGMLTEPSHPVQIYASIANLIIFFILARLEKLPRAPGFIFASYLGLYSIYRFLAEFLRAGYTAKIFIFGLTEAQALSLIIILASAIAVHFLRKRI